MGGIKIHGTIHELPLIIKLPEGLAGCWRGKFSGSECPNVFIKLERCDLNELLMSIQEKELSPEIFKETIPKKEVKNVLFVINQRPSDEVDQPLYFYLILVVADLPYDHHKRKRHLLFQISSSVIICARV